VYEASFVSVSFIYANNCIIYLCSDFSLLQCALSTYCFQDIFQHNIKVLICVITKLDAVKCNSTVHSCIVIMSTFNTDIALLFISYICIHRNKTEIVGNEIISSQISSNPISLPPDGYVTITFNYQELVSWINLLTCWIVKPQITFLRSSYKSTKQQTILCLVAQIPAESMGTGQNAGNWKLA